MLLKIFSKNSDEYLILAHPKEQCKIGDYLRKKGKEFGTVTNRKRRCGWFDANLVKQSVKINGVNDIVLTKLDVLDELKVDIYRTNHMFQSRNYIGNYYSEFIYYNMLYNN